MSEHRYFETVVVKGTVQLVEATSHLDEDYRKKGYAPLSGAGVTVYFDLAIPKKFAEPEPAPAPEPAPVPEKKSEPHGHAKK